ncbi:hypothetical protein ACQJBY_023733 [Aegilops geniculata]
MRFGYGGGDRPKEMRGARFNPPELQACGGIGRGHPPPLISSSASPFPQALHAIIRPFTPGGSGRGTTTAGTDGGTPFTPRSRSTGGPFRSEPNSPPSAAAARSRFSSHRSRDPPTSTPSSSTGCLRSARLLTM